jgi:hypothetical protein
VRCAQTGESYTVDGDSPSLVAHGNTHRFERSACAMIVVARRESGEMRTPRCERSEEQRTVTDGFITRYVERTVERASRGA